MDTPDADDLIEIRVMNEYGVDEGLWDEDGLTDGEELGLSDGLRHDLSACGRRWNDGVPASVWDDRWDGTPVMQTLVSWKYRVLEGRPSVRRAARAETVAMRRIGQELTARVQAELGPRYRVVHVP